MTEQEIKQTIELETQYFDLLKAKSNLRLSVLQKKLDAQPEGLTEENKLLVFAKHQQYKLKENEKAEQVKAMECRLDDLGVRNENMNKYFVHDPGNNGFETYATKAEQTKAAKEIIDSYLEEEWLEDVEDIVSGIILEKTTPCDVIMRPHKLTYNGFDEDGTYWPDGIKKMCNFKMVKA